MTCCFVLYLNPAIQHISQASQLHHSLKKSNNHSIYQSKTIMHFSNNIILLVFTLSATTLARSLGLPPLLSILGGPCGLNLGLLCPLTSTCQQQDPLCTDGANCLRVCVGLVPITLKLGLSLPRYTPCGGNLAGSATCSTGYICINDPYRQGCGLACDQLGICVRPVFCGGFANFKCTGGLRCIDDPRDSCDPNHGGADCGGICV
jgi:hypothetical protein